MDDSSIVERKYPVWDALKSMQKKEMWLGTREICPVNEYGISAGGVFTKMTLNYSLALIQTFVELMTNASDHQIRNPSAVTEIKIGFDSKTGALTVYNNGPGFDIDIHPKLGIYIPEFLASRAFAGTNLEKATDSGRISGGTNGLGIKLCNANAKCFIMQTVGTSKVTGKKYKYTQKFDDRLSVINPPTVIEVDKQLSEYTNILFLPSYNGDAKGQDGFGGFTPDIFSHLQTALLTRIYIIAAWLDNLPAFKNGKPLMINGNMVSSTPTTVYYNNMPIIVKGGISKIADMTSRTPPISTTIMVNDLPWNICVCVKYEDHNAITVVNGLIVDGGDHIRRMHDNICNKIRPAIEPMFEGIAKFQPRYITGSISIYARCVVVDPQFSSQTKKVMSLSAKMHITDFPAEFIQAITVAMKKVVTNDIFPSIAGKISLIRNKGVVTTEKHKKARFAGTAKSLQCSLIIAEGLSALGLIQEGLGYAQDYFNGSSSDYVGTFWTSGVPMNARKQVKDHKTRGGNTYRKTSKSLLKNIGFNDLISIIGLDPNNKYEDGIKGLNYGRLIPATDRDVDGCGNILGIIISNFVLLWPGLVKHGFITPLLTPLVRAIPRSLTSSLDVVEFGSEPDFELWVTNNGGRDKIGKAYLFKYYKGLASHGEEYTSSMFKNIASYIKKFYYDDKTSQTCDIYFGHDTNNRKDALRTPVTQLTLVQRDIIRKSSLIPCSLHLNTESKAYHLDNLIRKLPHVADGMMVTRRKILYGSMLYFANKKATVPVFQAGGGVTEKTKYHHGDMSMNNGIIGMAQKFPGTKRYPYLRADGRFGTRYYGGDDAGSPRYINVHINKKLVDVLFINDDLDVLQYVFESSKRLQPQYFAPVLPMVVLESIEIPSSGWKASIWARSLDHVVESVKYMIENDTVPDAYPPMKTVALETAGFSNRICKTDNELYIVGKYERVDDNIYITELPPGVWTEKYMEFIGKKCLKQDMLKDDPQSDPKYGINKVMITLRFRPGVLEEIINEDRCKVPGIDAIETFLEIYLIVQSHINLMKHIDPPTTITTTTITTTPTTITPTTTPTTTTTPTITTTTTTTPTITPTTTTTTTPTTTTPTTTTPTTTTTTTPTTTTPTTTALDLLPISDIKDDNELDGITVSEYKSYEAAILDWYIIRKRVYKDRIDREITLIKIRILCLSWCNKFSDEYDALGFKGTSTEQKITILDKQEYLKINKAKLEKPRYLDAQGLKREILGIGPSVAVEDALKEQIKNKHLIAAINKPTITTNTNTADDKDDEDDNDDGEEENNDNENNNDDADDIYAKKLSYTYLLSLRVNQIGTDSIPKRLKEIAKLQERLRYLTEDVSKPFVGAKIWLQEIDKATKVMRDGFNSGWMDKRKRNIKVKIA